MVGTSDVIEDTIRFFLYSHVLKTITMQVYKKKPSPAFDVETLKMANYVKHFVCSQKKIPHFDRQIQIYPPLGGTRDSWDAGR